MRTWDSYVEWQDMFFKQHYTLIRAIISQPSQSGETALFTYRARRSHNQVMTRACTANNLIESVVPPWLSDDLSTQIADENSVTSHTSDQMHWRHTLSTRI